MIRGLASAPATAEFAQNATRLGVDAEAFGSCDSLALSSIGLGTYLGDVGDEVDLMYTEAVVEAVSLGCNVVDTAVNYRCQRSERAVGAALERLVRRGVARREQIVVSTKGGYVPFDGAPPANSGEFRAYLNATYFESGVCRPEEMACNYQHCMAPRYLEHQLRTSLANLGLEAIDVYFLHNPEGQLADVPRPEFERRLREAFAFLESRVADGVVGRYGVATWNGFRVTEKSREHLSLERLCELAVEAAGPDHHFRVIQLPYNLALPEAYALYNQRLGDEFVTTVEAARALGVGVYASASLYQARLVADLPLEVVSAFGLETDAQRALQFVRSTPGIATALVGMSQSRHVRENLELLRASRADPEHVAGLFEES